MLLLRIIIYITPLLIFPYLLRVLVAPSLKKALPYKEYFLLSILVGIGLLAFAEFLLLQFFSFSPRVIIFGLVVESVFVFFYSQIAHLLFANTNSSERVEFASFKYPGANILIYIFIVLIIWHLANAISVFFHPLVWWDEIIHWVPKAKTLIESGSFQELNHAAIPEYPPLWPIILANFMTIQDKLTHLVPLVLHFIFWSFVLLTAFRLFVFKVSKNLVVFAIILVGVIASLPFTAPYADLPLAVFYCSALILMLQIIDGKIPFINLIYVGLMLGIASSIRPDGINHALVAIAAFCTLVIFRNKILALKSFIFLTVSTALVYIPWQIYLWHYSIYNMNLDLGKKGFSEIWMHWGYMFDKAFKLLQYTFIQIGNINRPYFILIVFLLLSLYSVLTKNRSRILLFSTLVILGNYLIIFIELLLTPTVSQEAGGIYWWFEANFVRLTQHYLPFVFFTSAYLLHETKT